MTFRHVFLLVAALFVLGGCASMPNKDPIQVTVAGMESLPGEGMEIRMLVKLRVQNPNQSQIDFTGAYVKLDVLGKTFATGVSSEGGTVPAFGETIVAVPVTVSVLRMVRQVAGMLDGKPVEKITYEMSGKLNGGLFNTERFVARGEFELPRSRARARRDLKAGIGRHTSLGSEPRTASARAVDGSGGRLPWDSSCP